VNIELTTLLSLKLLTCDLYYYVHLSKINVFSAANIQHYFDSAKSLTSLFHFSRPFSCVA
jgi:hypothetical protein